MTTQPDPTIRERLRELAEKATPGEWYQYRGEYVRAGDATVADCRYKNGIADAALIVEAVNALSALLDELDTLERRVLAATIALRDLVAAGDAWSLAENSYAMHRADEAIGRATEKARSLITEGQK